MNIIKKQGIAFLIALLVIFIPFYVSDAYAVNLNISKISGIDNINGFIRTNDMLTIEAEAEISASEDVEPDKMRIYAQGIQGYTYFQECSRISEGGSSFLCKYIAPLYNMAGTRQFRVDLHSGVTQYVEAGTPLSSATKDVTVDNAGAKVISISATPNRSHQSLTNITFTARDFGADETDTEHCSGVERIEFYLGDYSGDLVKIEYPSQYLCEYTSTFVYDAGGVDGKTTICARAFDRFNQTTIESKCADFYVDSGAPKPDQASFRVVKKDTDEGLNFVGTNAVMSDVSFIINAEDLVVESVKADLSSIAGARYTNAPYSSHDANGSVHAFTWKNIPVGPITACIITVDAADTIGNSDTTALQCGIKADDSGPSVKGLFTNFEGAGTYYLGKNTTLKAKITEAGVGLGKGDIFIDMSNLGLGTRMKADACNNTDGSNWDCLWYDVQPTVRDGIYPVTVLKESRDDLDNIMNSSFIQQIGVDTTSPAINQQVQLNVIAGVTEIPYENITIPGDTLEFILEVSDAWSAAADLTDLGGAEDALPESCWRENQSTYCMWEVPVTASGPYDADITFSFLDFTGNLNTVTKSIFVSGVKEEKNPNYWQNSVSCTPQFVDREISSLINQPVYCHISLRPINVQNAEVISFNMEQYPSRCYSNDAEISLTDYVQNVRATNNYAGSKNPYLELTLQLGEFLINGLEFSCEFEIFTKMDDVYTIYPEVENVTVNLQFYDLPSGDIGDKYEDDIDRHEKKIKWMGMWIDEVKLIYDYAAKVCEIYSAFATISAALASISALWGATAPLWGTPQGAALRTTWVGTCNADSEVRDKALTLKQGFLDKFCSYVNCKYSQKALDAMSKSPGLKPEGWNPDSNPGLNAAIRKGFDVKESIVWSVATLCIPGMILNMDKYRQVECAYLVCMTEDVGSGMPASICEAIYAYMSCTFWTGQVLNALPFFQLWTNLWQSFQQVVSDPLGFIFTALNYGLKCKALCVPKEEATWKHRTCSILGAINLLGDAINEVNGLIADDYWEIGSDEDYCSQWEEILADEEDEDEE